ncbi:MAG: ABC transporter permease [Chloroflexi bacterium]|nr:ABC transporter permease [Chloroflexota bacterium]
MNKRADARPKAKATLTKDEIQQKRARVSIASLLTVLTLYTLVSNSGLVNPVLIPTPQSIISTGFTLFTQENLHLDILTSLMRVLSGYFVGVTLAIVLGTLMGWFWVVDGMFDPLIEIIRPVPPLAYIPLMILWFGIDETPKILVIMLGCFVNCIINVVAGVKNVPLIYIEAARTMGAKNRDLFFTVVLPAAVPYILTGLRVALGTAWAILVAAELIAAQRGLGFMMTNARRFFRTDAIMVGIFCIGILAFSMDRLLRYVNGRLTTWMERR